MPLKRRSVLIAGAVTPLAVLPSTAVAAAPVLTPPVLIPPDAAPLSQTSRTVEFGEGWRFVLANPTGITDPTGQYASAADPTYDDSTWRAVDLPHDWSIELTPEQAPDTSSGTGFFHGGLGWYRKEFTLPSNLAGKRISVEFDGVYMDSYVYLNGTLLGNHPYGYTGFSLDLTGQVHTDGSTTNVLAVKVQNQLPSSRWYSGSGIYRNVRLVVTDPVHVRRWGTFVTTPELTASASAGGLASGPVTVRVRTDIANESGAAAQVRIVSTILDAAGRRVGQATSTVPIDPTGSSDTVEIPVDRPRLWSTDHPYLYTLRTELSLVGRVVDTYHTTFGIRHAQFDPDHGFSLNGTRLKLYGVDLHHDQGALGSAIHFDALLRQMKIMKSMGVNAFRTSHNPPSPEMVRVCEQLGIVMMVEAFDCWQRGKNPFDYGRFFNAYSDIDITEMVNAAKNSPAVIMWSIGNEIPDSTSTAGLAMAQRLIDDIRAIDTTRPVVIGSDKYRGLPRPGSAADLMLAKLDGLGVNYNTAASVDALHATYPHLFLFESESSSETSTRGAYQEPEHLNTGENYTPGRRATSSYDNNLASWTMSGEYGLKKDRDREFFAGQFLWSGMDYIGEPTPYNVFPVKASFFGAVDTAGFPKDMYYLFQSQWTDAPMVHLVPMNWTDHEPGESVEVWAYSTVDTVELFLNGQSLGVRTFDHKTTGYGLPYLETTEATHDDKTVAAGPYPGSYTSPNGSAGKLHLTWTVPFAPGTLLAVARHNGAEVARDELRTAGPAYALRLSPDRKVIGTGTRSLCYVTATVVDERGVPVPSAGNTIDFEATRGSLAGVDNGQQESAERYQASSRAAFNGKALAVVRAAGKAGPITVTASAAGLLPATIDVYAFDRDRADRELVGSPIALDPVRLRVPVGDRPRLPATVPAVYPDGTTRPVPVHWAGLPADLRFRPGVYRVSGTASGTRLPAQAVITAQTAAGAETVSVVVPVGVAPILPATVRVSSTDGVAAAAPVTWQAIDPARYAAPGQFTVSGGIARLARSAAATVRVTDALSTTQNLAAATGPASPSADASYSGAANTLPAALLDGVVSAGGWSNAFSKAATALLPVFNAARPSDWVAVSWPNPQRFGQLTAHFTVDTRHALPAAIAVTYWNGTADVPVQGLVVGWVDTVATLSFTPVATTRVRLALTSAFPGATNGSIQISELEVTGDAVTYQTIAALSELTIDGRQLPGFDPGVTDYDVAVGRSGPTIMATAAANGRVLVLPAPALPGTARVIVTAEDGLTHRTYSVHLKASPG